jgi:hypothetical protein
MIDRIVLSGNAEVIGKLCLHALAGIGAAAMLIWLSARSSQDGP